MNLPEMGMSDIISALALLVSLGVGLSGMRQTRISAAQLQLAQRERGMDELSTLHQARVDALEATCEDLRADAARAQRHFAHCERELARLRRVLAAHHAELVEDAMLLDEPEAPGE